MKHPWTYYAPTVIIAIITAVAGLWLVNDAISQINYFGCSISPAYPSVSLVAIGVLMLAGGGWFLTEGKESELE